MNKDDLLRLKHIIDAIERIKRHLKNASPSDLKTSEVLFDAVTKQLIIIGEAAANLSEKFQSKHTNIPFHKIVGMRNRLIHEYFNVSPDVVWATIQKDIPKLNETISRNV